MPRFRLHDDGDWKTLVFHCPGCKRDHPIRVKAPQGPVWSWDGNLDAPTVSPSLLCDQNDPERRCHLFLIGGRIRFLDDCHHALRGQLVDVPEMPE